MLDYSALTDAQVVELALVDVRYACSISTPVVDQLVRRGLVVPMPSGHDWRYGAAQTA